MCTEFFRPIDSDYMEWDLRWLRRQARKAVALGTELGVENKTDAEIRKETDELVMTALLTAIRRYDPSYEIGVMDTPKNFCSYLRRLIYEYLRSQKNHNSFVLLSIDDINEQINEHLRNELNWVADFIKHEYNRRLYEYEKMEAQQ
jgi:hypothetical protein